MRHIEKQQFIILLAAVVLFGGFVVLRYVPILRQRSAISGQMKALDQNSDQINEVGVMVPELRAQVADMQQQLETFSVKVPEGRRFAGLWHQIAEIMNTCELTEQLVQPGTEIKSDELCCIPLAIECKGTMRQMFQFFQSLEQVERLLQVEKATFENSSDISGLVTLNATVNVYYQPGTLDNG